MNAQTMTCNELRDWLANDDGWERWQTVPDGNNFASWYWERSEKEKVRKMGWTHPFPHTIDAAASAMPSGWNITLSNGEEFGKYWSAVKDDSGHEIRVYCTTDEITERFRLAVLARLYDKQKPQEI